MYHGSLQDHLLSTPGWPYYGPGVLLASTSNAALAAIVCFGSAAASPVFEAHTKSAHSRGLYTIANIMGPRF